MHNVSSFSCSRRRSVVNVIKLSFSCSGRRSVANERSSLAQGGGVWLMKGVLLLREEECG